jgi:hypothetical protein
MLFNPELIRQYAHHIAEEIRARERRNVSVSSRVTASLHGRPRQYLVDPDVDLSREDWRWGHSMWIRPLVE